MNWIWFFWSVRHSHCKLLFFNPKLLTKYNFGWIEVSLKKSIRKHVNIAMTHKCCILLRILQCKSCYSKSFLHYFFSNENCRFCYSIKDKARKITNRYVFGSNLSEKPNQLQTSFCAWSYDLYKQLWNLFFSYCLISIDKFWNLLFWYYNKNNL